MPVIEIHASYPYRVEISPGLLSHLGERTRQLVGGRTVCIVTDDIVAKLYLPQAETTLKNAGFTPCHHIIAHGEGSKDGRNYLMLLDALSRYRLTREDVVIALGGGVVGDLAGFAAATYLRGIPYIQVPTTLLAMVDSSVGGKTAINLATGKNLAGAFYQPRFVLCDPEVLSTLPEADFRSGCAEVIKYAILQSPEMFHCLLTRPVSGQLLEVIPFCVTAKQYYVEHDEFDRGARQFLNFGHTLGHAVEAASNYTCSHGQAVAIGMAMVARAAAAMGLCDRECCDRIQAILTRYGLPLRTDISADELLQATLSDKKRQGDTLTLVVPQTIGRCILHQISTDELPRWIGLGG